MDIVLAYIAGFLTPIVLIAVGFFVFRRRLQRDPSMLLRKLPTVGGGRPPLRPVRSADHSEHSHFQPRAFDVDASAEELEELFGDISPESS